MRQQLLENFIQDMQMLKRFWIEQQSEGEFVIVNVSIGLRLPNNIRTYRSLAPRGQLRANYSSGLIMDFNSLWES